MTAEETVAFSLWDVYFLGPECSPAFILQQHFLFPGEPLLPTQVWESPPVAGWTTFNLSVFLISSAKVRAAWENIPNPHVPLSESPPPCRIFIYMARVAARRISIFRLCFLPNYIPNTVDHKHHGPYIPLLALIYTNTHLLGQGRLGENYSRLIYDTQGRAKGRGSRLAWPHFLLSWSPS